MNKSKLAAIILLLIAVCFPASSQQLRLKGNSFSLIASEKNKNSHKIISDDLSIILHAGIGADFESYFASGLGLTLGFADIVDMDISFDKCGGINVTGDGSGTGTNVLLLRGFGTMYIAKEKIKLSLGAGKGIITNKDSYPSGAKDYFIFSLKTEVFFNKYIGVGLDCRIGKNPVYENSIAQFMLNFNFRPFKGPVF